MSNLQYCVVSDGGIDYVCDSLENAKKVAQALSIHGRTEVHLFGSSVTIDEGDCIIVTESPLFAYETVNA